MTPELLRPALAAIEPRVAGARFLVGITGPPAAGKSTLATALAGELNVRCGPAVPVPMDGFHLSNVELDRLGLAHRKGAPQTFDASGFVHLLRRLRAADEPLVYAPAYSRTLHESIGGVVPIPREVRVIVVEGNYLLHDEDPWHQVRSLIDLVAYVDAPDSTRHEALVRRQIAKGLDAGAARAWVDSSDEVNARLIATTRDRADVILTRR
jgi:pantothenate kinase